MHSRFGTPAFLPQQNVATMAGNRAVPKLPTMYPEALSSTLVQDWNRTYGTTVHSRQIALLLRYSDNWQGLQVLLIKKKKRLVSLPKHFLFSEWWWSHEFVQFHMLKPKAAVINKKTSNGQRSARTRQAAMLYAMPVHGKPTCKWLTHWFRSQAKHSTHCHVHWMYFFGCPLLPSSWKMHGSSVWFTM